MKIKPVTGGGFTATIKLGNVTIRASNRDRRLAIKGCLKLFQEVRDATR